MNKSLIKKIVVLIVALVCSILPIYNIWKSGVFGYQIVQPEFVEGGIELIILALLIMIGWAIGKKNIIFPLCVGSFLYLVHHGVIIPVITDFMYMVALIFVGFCVCKIDKEMSIFIKISKWFVCGMAIWTFGAIVCSLCKQGTINDLRYYTVFLIVVSWIFGVATQKFNNNTFLCNSKIRFECNLGEACCLTLIVLVILCLFAKTNTAQDFDSLWYGLRPEYVLTGENSFYDNLGYISFVYYYPKLMELIWLPISGLGDYSFIQCANVGVYVMALVAVYGYLSEIVKCNDRLLKLQIVLAVASIPALANISATAKPDIMGFYFVLCAFIFASRFFVTRNLSEIVYTYVALLMCTGTKETYLLWGGIIFVWFTICLIVMLLKKKLMFNMGEINKEDIILTISAIGAVVGVHYRTYKLIGYPIFPVGLGIMKKFLPSKNNFILQDYSVVNAGFSFEHIIERLNGFIFNPQQLGHVIILWTSNIIIIVSILFLCFKKQRLQKREILLGGIMILTTVYYMTTIIVPDGNYFIEPIIVSVLIMICNTSIDRIGNNRFITAILCIAIIVQLPIMFISHSSWAWGTASFSKELVRSNFETAQVNERIFESNGLQVIENEVSGYSINDKVIASGSEDGRYFRLDCNVETFLEIGQPSMCNGIISQSYEAFEKFAQDVNVKAIILDKQDNTTFAQYTEEYIRKNGYLYSIEDTLATCYVFR